MGGTWTGQEFDASICGDSLCLRRSWDFVKNGADGRDMLGILRKVLKKVKTLLREMMAGGLIGLEDHGVENAGERTNNIGTATLN